MNDSRFSTARTLCLCTIAILLLSANTYAQDVRINEFMALNVSSVTDEDSEYSDWIEIYNSSSEIVNLQEYALTDDSTDLQKWVFPDVSIDAHSYLLVFASGKDRAIAGGELHTSFKLSGSGEYLSLINASGDKLSVFAPSFPEQSEDVSYGYYDGGYLSFAMATAGAENNKNGGVAILAPSFSREHGYFDTAFILKINTSLSSASIYYTTDGSKPSSASGQLYQDGIQISKTTVLRAVVVLDNVESPVTTQSYFFVDDIIHQTNNPEGYPADWGNFTTLNGLVPADYEMDPDMVADANFAELLKKALVDIPTVSLVTNRDNFFSHEEDVNTGGIYVYTGAPLSRTTYDKGRGWERPVSFEFFNNGDESSLQVDCGISLNGGHSRLPEKNNKHSFRLYFKSEYGPTRLRYPIFGESAAKSFNSLILRAGFNNSWMHQDASQRVKGTYMRDSWAKDIQRAMGHNSSQARYTHLYINGIYWGLYSIAERMDNEFAASYMEGDAEDFDVIKDYSEVMDGSGDGWAALLDAVNEGVTDEVYQRIQGNNPDGTPNPDYKPLIDMDNFIDYMLINFYGANSDWDHHNWAAMFNHKKRGPGFQFFVWDGEHLIKETNDNILNEFNEGCPSNIFQRLRENGLFKRRWADRANKHFSNGGLLSTESALSFWHRRKAQIELAVNGEAARWGDYRRDVFNWNSGPYELYTKETHWDVEQDFMINTYFPKRDEVFLEQMQDAGLFPSVAAPHITLNNETTQGGDVVSGDVLKMSADEGVIYYTLNGMDPAGANASDLVTRSLLDATAEKYVLVPTSDIGSEWTGGDFIPADWQTVNSSPGGVGYENGSGYESYLSLDLKDKMLGSVATNANTSCYIRIRFEVDKAAIEHIGAMTLKMLYDDGFVAYLNGTQVASANAPFNLQYNSASAGGHEANSYESFNIIEYANLLVDGDNILAIHGLNEKTTSSDFIINATIEAGLVPESEEDNEALIYNDPLILEQSTLVKARAFVNNEWSPLREAYFCIPSELENIRITEVHYHPLPNDTIDGDKYEFVELKNVGASILNLSDVKLIKGVEYSFTEETYLEPGAFIVLVSDEEDFLERYGIVPFDDYKGQLDNNGERIVLADSDGDTIATVRYYDDQPWPVLADAGGYSLVPTDPNPEQEQDSSMYWQLSYEVGGSPGEDDYYTSVDVIGNEIKENILSNCYPNPFTDFTSINFKLPTEAHVQLRIIDIMGKLVNVLTDSHYTEGTHQVIWNGTNLSQQKVSSGIYLFQLVVSTGGNETIISKKVVLEK